MVYPREWMTAFPSVEAHIASRSIIDGPDHVLGYASLLTCGITLDIYIYLAPRVSFRTISVEDVLDLPISSIIVVFRFVSLCDLNNSCYYTSSYYCK